MTKRSLYVVCKTLDQPICIIGLPLDEFLITTVIAGFFFIIGKLILSMVIGLLTVILLRIMKRGQGSGWLINVFYWYLPQKLSKAFIRYTPASKNREWIS